MKHSPRRCTALRKDGHPCRSWAVRDTDQPLCASHSEASHSEASHQPPLPAPQSPIPAPQPLGFYAAAYSVQEATDLLAKTQAKNLNGELTVARLLVRHTLLLLKQERDPAQHARLAALIFKGARTIAAIMRVQHSISSRQNQLLPPELRAALDEISTENDYDL